MNVKLTLSVNEELVTRARRYAKKKRKSLSGLVENYLKTLSTGNNSEEKMHPELKKFYGKLKLTDKRGYKAVYREEIVKKLTR
jgi:replicative DNA helicase